jgi:SAM-dependent methyltransferase
VSRARLATTLVDPIRSREVRPMLDRLDLDTAESVLDLGCAGGIWTNYLRKRVGRVVGVDVDPEAVAFAKRLYPAADVRVADGERLPFGDGEFDRVLFISTLEHIGHPRASLTEVARVLEPGGLLAMSVDTLDHPAWVGMRDLHAKRSFIEHFFSRDTIVQLARESGLEPVWGRYIYGSRAAQLLLRPRLAPTELHWLLAPAVRAAGALADDEDSGMMYQSVFRRIQSRGS